MLSIKSGGHADISRHINGKRHRKLIKTSSESVIVRQGSDENNNVAKLDPQEAVLKAETLQALKVVSSNYSFASTADDGDHFSLIFHDLAIAKKYRMSKEE